ncbi:MAG: hypothetical protein GY751_12970 [Bacteroidetes bacterium]|nr:hypothetical protein [Bacteroidota bacterium]
MRYQRNFLLLFLIFLMAGCRVEPQPIRYGEEMCHYCTMTIVEPGFGAEVVTNKGKAFKFDAIECMMNYVKENGDDGIALFLTNVLVDPGTLYNARELTFLRSESIPSPMGAFLSAYPSEEEARITLGTAEGEFYDWEGIVKYFEAHSR